MDLARVTQQPFLLEKVLQQKYFLVQKTDRTYCVRINKSTVLVQIMFLKCLFKHENVQVNIPQGQLLYLHFITIFSSGIWWREETLLDSIHLIEKLMWESTTNYTCTKTFNDVLIIQTSLHSVLFYGWNCWAWVLPALWIHRKRFRLADETFLLSLRPLLLERVWTPEPSADL